MPPPRSPRPWTAAALALFAAGCNLGPPPVRVVPLSADALRRDFVTCALDGNAVSARTRWGLRLLEAEEAFEDDPRAALRDLHVRMPEAFGHNASFALAELSYLAGKRLGDRECFLAAAVYAYEFLLGEGSEEVSPYDRRFRWACDVYNRSLVRAFETQRGARLALTPGRRELPAGVLDVDVDVTGFPFVTDDMQLLPADGLEVKGLSFRVRDSGLGAPLIAVIRRKGEGTAGVGLLDRTSVSATAFLRVKGNLQSLPDGLAATLELHSTYDANTLDIQGRQVPLESDLSATIAYGTAAADYWRFDLSNLFSGEDAARKNGLILPRPFEPGRIPVVLVHGTASSPAYWAELINALSADPLVRGRFQFWLFIYSSGNPIAYSASTLRQSLEELVAERDPDGEDLALQHMVLVGHSQGGLLCKMLGVTLSADEVTRTVLGSSVDDLRLDAQEAELLRRCFDLEPLPCVDRLVFLATPHRGSFLAGGFLGRFTSKLIAVPGEVVDLTRGIAGGGRQARLPAGLEDHVPTSVDNQDPDNPTLKLLAATAIDPRIHVHSIIPIGSAEDPENADDGVVSYKSAHLDTAESEVLVPSGHSCQAHPRTFIEVRRILREHLAELEASRAGVDEPSPR